MTTNNSFSKTDLYFISLQSIITNYDKEIILNLYQPLIGFDATILYLNLLNISSMANLFDTEKIHSNLLNQLQMTVKVFLIARSKLEAIGLIKTFYHHEKNTYIYELYAPFNSQAFFNNPLLNITLYNYIGKVQYQNLVCYYEKLRLDKKDFVDISTPFNQVYESSVNMKVSLTSCYDKQSIGPNLDDVSLPFIEELIASNQITKNTVNNEIIELLRSLILIYNLSTNQIKDIIISSLNAKKLIDREKMRKYARNIYMLEHHGKTPQLIYKKTPEYLQKSQDNISPRDRLIYQFEHLSPYNFLKAKNKSEPAMKELKLLENLLVDQQIPPGVVNVLIDYVLKVSQNRLNRNLIETIASEWKRNNVQTVDEAMSKIESHYINKSTKKVTTKKEIKPEWFDQDNEIESLSIEESDQLEKLLKEFE